MRSCGSFDSTGIEIANCGLVNFIFGANGTGKTTISNYLSNVDNPSFSRCSVKWERDEIDVVVYNKTFRDKVIRQHLPGVFSLGEEAGDLQESIKKLVDEIAQAEAEVRKYENTKAEKEAALQSARAAFETTVWDLLHGPFKDAFSGPFKGFNTKALFAERLLSCSASNGFRRKGDLEADCKSLFGSDVEPIMAEEELFEVAPDIREHLFESETDGIWSTLVVGRDDLPISELIHQLSNESWVKQGISFIRDDRCPFCQQSTLTPNLVQQINDFFGGKYSQQNDHINELKRTYLLAIEQLEVSHGRLTASLSSRPVSTNDVDIAWKALHDGLLGNRSLIEEKVSEPNRVMHLRETSARLWEYEQSLKALCEQVVRRNEQVERIGESRNRLSQEVWSFLRNEADSTVKLFTDQKDDHSKAIEALDAKISAKKRLITESKRLLSEYKERLAGTTQSVVSINELMKAYGFNSFSLRESNRMENCYEIIRDSGELAHETLSEGETTLIAFLYFIQLRNGSFYPDGASRPRVMVIDDPVSSLDSANMYLISTLVREIGEEAVENTGMVKQLFLFTHNAFFHKEVTQGQGKFHNKAQYWMLRKTGKQSTMECYGTTNPVQTTYRLLWNELIEAKEKQYCVGIQNSIRRIMEWYFGFLGGGNWEAELLSKFEGEDKRVVISLLRWSNQGSHAVQEEIDVCPSGEETGNYLRILREAFDKTGHISHYNMMMGEE